MNQHNWIPHIKSSQFMIYKVPDNTSFLFSYVHQKSRSSYLTSHWRSGQSQQPTKLSMTQKQNWRFILLYSTKSSTAPSIHHHIESPLPSSPFSNSHPQNPPFSSLRLSSYSQSFFPPDLSHPVFPSVLFYFLPFPALASSTSLPRSTSFPLPHPPP
jgi:hypothetical protein